MKIIPVIDLLGGVIVHAKNGERASYQPILSKLTRSSQALDIVAALLEVYPFEKLYIADLDAIQKLNTSNVFNYNVIDSIKKQYPALELWVDAGIKKPDDLNIWNMSDVNIVIGSENFESLIDFLTVQELLQDNFILSLDYFANGYKGPLELIENAKYWPKNVIVMSLANVGANLGVDTPILNSIKQLTSSNNIYAAGGVRNLEDLQTLQSIGVQGALLATSLHQQQITTLHLESINKKSPIKNWAFSKLNELKNLL